MAYEIDSNGLVIAEIHPMPVGADPNRYVDVNVPDGMFWPKWNGTAWVENGAAAHVTIQLAAVRERYKHQIDELAEVAKQTTQTPGYAMARTYDRKADEAIAWDADNNALTPIIDAEIARTSETKQTLVDAIIAKNTSWLDAIGDIEGIRRVAKTAIDSDVTNTAMTATVTQCRKDLDGYLASV